MIAEDLEFTMCNKNNQEVVCKILSLLPKDSDNYYVLFIDGEVDANKNLVFKYGILSKVNDEYELKKDVTEEELILIVEKFHEEVVGLANSIVANE